MQTRCPNPTCKTIFDVPPEKEGRNLPCPECGQVITVRSLEVLLELERRKAVEQKVNPERETGVMPDRSESLQVLVEDVRSLWNVGSIFRTSDGAGFGRVHLCGITGRPPRKEITKTALGADETIPWEHHLGAMEVVPALLQQKIQLVALEENDQSKPLMQCLSEGLIKTPMCLLVGNEVAGLSAEVLDSADIVCSLPMRGSKQSLNVSVAFGIAAYQLADALL